MNEKQEEEEDRRKGFLLISLDNGDGNGTVNFNWFGFRVLFGREEE